MLLWLTEFLSRDIRAFNVFSYLTLRAVLACMTALVISFVIGPRMIVWLARMKIGQSVRDDGPQTHLVKAGTPTMGGALILVSIIVTTLLWGDLENRFVWIVLRRDGRLRRGRLGRRLAQGGAPQPEGAVGADQAVLAIADRTGRGGLARVRDLGAGQRAVREAAGRVGAERLQRRPLAEGRPHRAAVQVDHLSAGRLGLPRADLLRHRRHQQRGQPDRRSRRTGDHADGDDRRGAGCVRLRFRQRHLRQVPAVPVHTGRRRARGHLRRDRRRRAWVSSGSTRIRPRCSWAMSARSRWAPRWARSPSSSGRRSCCSSWAACSSSRRCR